MEHLDCPNLFRWTPHVQHDVHDVYLDRESGGLTGWHTTCLQVSEEAAGTAEDAEEVFEDASEEAAAEEEALHEEEAAAEE